MFVFIYRTKMSSITHRTCYQSINFENLQQFKRKPMLKTLDALSAANFSILSTLPFGCEYLDMVSHERGLEA
jgi:hypothetical protein